jgi:thymidylate synthase
VTTATVNPRFNPHDATYADMLRHILANGDGHDDRTGVGTTSVFGYQCRYDLQSGFPLLTTKKMAWRSICTELAWFLLGRTDNQWLMDRGCTIWREWSVAEQCAKFGRQEGDLGPVYGHQWRRFGWEPTPIHNPFGGDDGVDQIKALCNDLATNPNSRRLIVTGWNPKEATQVALPPCHTLWQCKVRTVRTGCGDVNSPDFYTRYLDLHLYQRSADSFLGVPFNIASYALLQQVLALTHGFMPGHFIHTFGDLHVYNNHREQVAEQLSRESFAPPVVTLPGEFAGRGFAGVMDWARRVGEYALDRQKPDDQRTDFDNPVMLHNYQCHDPIKAPVAV